MNEPLKSVALFYRGGTSDKEYHITLEAKDAGYVVNFAYGKRGSTLHRGTKTQTPLDLAAATKLYDKIEAGQRREGYTSPDDGGVGHSINISDNAGEASGLVPQLLNEITLAEALALIDHPDYWMEEKHDGNRTMCRVDGGKVYGSNRRGIFISLPPEITAELAQVGNCVLDGELIGREYFLFDILMYDGVAMDHFPFSQRRIYRDSLAVGPGFTFLRPVYTYKTAAEKRAIFDRLLATNREGVVFKRIDAPYTPGKPASGGDQLKYKFYATCTATVMKVNKARSVALELEGIGIGNVTIPPNYEVPAPGVIVEVKYLHYFPNGSLYQPSFKGVRDDVDPDMIASLKVKGG